MTQEERDWIDVILAVDNNLYLSNSLQKRTDNMDKKRQRVFDYLKLIDEYNKRCRIRRGTPFEAHYKQIFFYNSYLIKEENIPDSYYEHQLDLRRKMGVKADSFSKDDKHKIALEVIDDQKNFLDEWIDYFLYGNGVFYPIYEKYWAFQGIQKLGLYNKRTGKFSTRNKNTVYPVPSIDEKALEMTLTLMENFIRDKEVIPGLEQAFHSYNFKSLYEYSLKEVMKKEKFVCLEGIWKKYERNSDYRDVVRDVRGKHTGWCIDRRSWVKQYLSKTDFYIFFTKDVYGKYSDPRITIRVKDDEVVEVRGISEEQNMEADMLPIACEKLHEFSISEKLMVTEAHMSFVSIIEDKINKNIPLDMDELRFIYQIDTPILSFGCDLDPRVNEIVSKRNIKEDLSVIFDVPVSKIALNITELNSETKVYFGNLSMVFNENVVNVSDDLDDYTLGRGDVCVPDIIVGDCFLNGDYDRMPKSVSGNFQVVCPENVDKLILPSLVSIHLTVRGVQKAKEIVLPLNSCYDISFPDLFSCDKLYSPSMINGKFDFPNLFYGDKITFPLVVKGSMIIPRLIDTRDYRMPRYVGGNMNISNLLFFDEDTIPETVVGIIKCNNYSFENDKGRKIK